MPQSSRPRSLTPLIVSVALFLSLDLSVLLINQHVASRVDADSRLINLAGQQRMLTERLAKAALLDAREIEQGLEEEAHAQMMDAASRFSATQAAFLHGGTPGLDGHAPIGPLEDKVARALLLRIEQAWQPTAAAMQQLIDRDIAPPARGEARQMLLRQEPILLLLANELTSRIEAVSRERTERLRRVQLAAFALALLNFCFLMYQLLYRYHLAAREGERLQRLIDGIAAGVCVTNGEGEIVALNPAACALFGHEARGLLGRPLASLVEEREGVWAGKRPDEEGFFAELHRYPLTERDRALELVTLLDVTARVHSEARLRDQAQHDALTALPNRRLFEDRLAVALAQAIRTRKRLGLALVDLDRFKPINDVHGHAVGDTVLREVADRLLAAARAGDTVARLGGDEFVCVFTGIGSRADLEVLGERLLESLHQPLVLEGRYLPLGASVGLALYPDDADEASGLLAHADAAMYRAKQAGGGGLR